jgi:hypothetical protein
MKNALKTILSSKRFLTAVASGVAWGVGKLGLALPTDELFPMIAPLWAYIVTQGLADHGKNRPVK